MGWIEKHASLLVVILVIDENRVLALERKREPPVPAQLGSHWPPSKHTLTYIVCDPRPGVNKLLLARGCFFHTIAAS